MVALPRTPLNHTDHSLTHAFLSYTVDIITTHLTWQPSPCVPGFEFHCYKWDSCPPQTQQLHVGRVLPSLRVDGIFKPRMVAGKGKQRSPAGETPSTVCTRSKGIFYSDLASSKSRRPLCKMHLQGTIVAVPDSNFNNLELEADFWKAQHSVTCNDSFKMNKRELTTIYWEARFYISLFLQKYNDDLKG